MTTKAMILGAAAHSLMAGLGTSSKVADALRESGEAFVMDDGELIDPDRIQSIPDGFMVQKETSTSTVDSDGLPNRLSIDRSSRYYTNCGNYVGVKLDGNDAPNCIEFCVSEGWVRLGNGGATVSRAEVRDAQRQYGKVEVYWRSPPSRQVRRQMARLAR